MESLEELKELNRRQRTVDYEGMLKQYQGETAEERRAREEREDDDFIKYGPILIYILYIVLYILDTLISLEIDSVK